MLPRYWFDDVPNSEFENNATTTDVWVALSTDPVCAVATQVLHREEQEGAIPAALPAALLLGMLADNLVDRGAHLPVEVTAVFPRRDALPDVIAHPEPALLRIDGEHVLGCTMSFGPIRGFYAIHAGHWVVGMVSSDSPLNLSMAHGPTADRWLALD